VTNESPQYNMLIHIVCPSFFFPLSISRIGGVMVSVLALRAVDRGFESQSGQTKDYIIGICCFSAKYAVLRRKRKYWVAWHQNNVCEWNDIS
jgi:hypothetical protein